jgi:hypothetical protein
MPENRIPAPIKGLMVVFCLFIDFVLKPFLFFGILDIVGDIVAAFVLSIWCSGYGISLFGSGRNAIASFGTVVLEAVPGIDVPPWWTIRVLFL